MIFCFQVKPNLATTLYVSTGDAVVIDIANKYFQLEEMEDKDSCITEIFFNPNKTISVGNTDGPIPLSCDGDWELSEDGGLKMTLKRTYSGGQPHTDMGEFTFDVERTYVAQPEKIGNLLGFSGSIHENYHGDAKVGFFELIDTTEAKENSD